MKIEELNSEIENLNSELLKNKNSSKEYLIKKEKEIDRLKNRIKKENQQKNGTSYYDGTASDIYKNSENLMSTTNTVIPHEFLNGSSENDSDPKSKKLKIIIKGEGKNNSMLEKAPGLVKQPRSVENNLKGENFEGISIEHVKNIYISYLEYKAMKNDKEAKT